MTQINEDFSCVMNDYYFSFGAGHHHGPDKERLHRNYTIIRDWSERSAIETMKGRRGLKWGSSYRSADQAGVDRWGLVLIQFCDLKPQQGENL